LVPGVVVTTDDRNLTITQQRGSAEMQMIFSDSFSMSAIIASLLSLSIDDLHPLVPPYAIISVIVQSA
jgi:hypothetical protein